MVSTVTVGPWSTSH